MSDEINIRVRAWQRIVVAILLLVGMPAGAQPPAGAIPPPAPEYVTVKRETLEVLVAAAESSLKVRELLQTCQDDVDRAAKKNQPAPGWYTAVKWAGVGGAVIGAFVLGMAIGR